MWHRSARLLRRIMFSDEGLHCALQILRPGPGRMASTRGHPEGPDAGHPTPMTGSQNVKFD